MAISAYHERQNMSELKKVSFVIPCYNSSRTIGKVIEEIKETMKKCVPTYREPDEVNGDIK